MGSACCTAARSKEPSDGWSMEHSRCNHDHRGYRHRGSGGSRGRVLSQSRWSRKFRISKTEMDDDCTMLPTTSRSPISSSNRSFRSISSSGVGTVSSSSQQMHGTEDTTFTIFNSPFLEFLQSHSSSSDDADDDPVVEIHSDSGLRSRALLCQESVLSTSSNSFGSASHKTLDGPESSVYNKETHLLNSDDILTSRTGSFSKKKLESESASSVPSFEMEPLRRRIRTNVDAAAGSARGKSYSWKVPQFSDLIESSFPGSSRWPNVDISSDSSVAVGLEDLSEGYIWNLGAICNQEFQHASASEAQKCGLCSKDIYRKSPWSLRVWFPGSKELPVVGVLDCGHVYHAECLDHATPATHAHDPPCPKCDLQKKLQNKFQEGSCGSLKAVGYSGHSSVKGKSSTVSVMKENLNIYKGAQQNHSSFSGSSSKAAMQSLVRNAERSFSAKSLLRKQFNFKGKYKESLGPKRPGYAARVSPENSIREDDYVEKSKYDLK